MPDDDDTIGAYSINVPENAHETFLVFLKAYISFRERTDIPVQNFISTWNFWWVFMTNSDYNNLPELIKPWFRKVH